MKKILFTTVPVLAAILSAVFIIMKINNGSPETVPHGVEPWASVLVAHDEWVNVAGENPKHVPLGGDVSFDLGLPEERMVDAVLAAGDGSGETPANVTVSGSTLTVRDVTEPLTLNVTTRLRDRFSYSFGKNVTSSREAGTLYEGTEITVTSPETLDGRAFVGYTAEKSLEDGGKVVSYAAEYVFELSGNTKLFANYASPGASLLFYKGNGGTAAGGNNMTVEWVKDFYLCPNTLADNSSFARDGYVLAGYTTEPDGSGRYYGCGWNVVMPEDGVEYLYCQWLPETDASEFTYEKTKKAVVLKKYLGSSDTVVIPETIGGLKVTKIGAGCFEDAKITSCFISKNVTAVADGAFKNCTELEKLYICDTVTSMTDAAFTGCEKLSTVYLQAVNPPKYMSARTGTYHIKYERLITAKKPKMVFVGGSNLTYGMISPEVAEAFPDYEIINYGNRYETPAAFYLECISKWLGEGDILVYVPEAEGEYLYGFNEMNEIIWQMFEGAYDSFADVDLRHYPKLLESFAAFNKTRASRKASYDYETHSETINEYGDYFTEKVGQEYTPLYNTKELSVDLVTKNIDELNRALRLCRDAGAKVYLSFGTINELSLTEEARSAAGREAFENAARENIFCDAVISRLSDYIMDTKYFFNTDFHLNTEGAGIRTAKLISDLTAQIEKDTAD